MNDDAGDLDQMAGDDDDDDYDVEPYEGIFTQVDQGSVFVSSVE